MFKKVLYPVDLAHVEFAAGFASDVERIADTFGAEVELMTVMPGFGMAIVASYFPADAEEKARREMERRLGEFAGQAFQRKVELTVAKGTHWKRIIETARERDVDLIVMPHSDKGWAESHLVGSCAQKVVEGARCSVLLLRPSAGRDPS